MRAPDICRMSRARSTLPALTVPAQARLWLEFAILFAGVPVAMAVFFGQYPLFPVLIGLTAVALVLLWLTPDFELKELLRGPVLGEWRIIVGFTLATAAVCAAVALTLVPQRFLSMPLYNTGFWLMLMVVYPIASALPQELIFRPLFFRRYGRLFPNVGTAVAVNAVAFGLGHLFYMNWVTITMTAFGGAVMGWAYMRHRSFLLAWLLHSIGGQIIFTAGLGIYFYHGAVGR